MVTATLSTWPRLTRAALVVGHLLIAGALAAAVRPLVGVGYLALVVGATAARRAWRRRHAPRRTLQFTREGKALVAITLGIGVGAINSGNNLLYLMLGMLLSMIIVSGILSEHTLRSLTVQRTLPRDAFAGQPFLTAIALTNGKRRLPSYSVQIEDVIDGRPAPKKCYFLKVPAGREQQTSYRSVMARRGAYTFEGLRIGTRFPFGFFVKRRRVDAPDTLLVYPEILSVAALPLPAQDLLGAAHRPKRGQGREFHGLRAWRAGDDARDIHWTRSARINRLVLREYEHDGARQVGLYLARHHDPAQPLDEAAGDRLVTLAASLMTHFTGRGFDVSLVVDGQPLTVRPDGRGRRPALRALAVAHFDGAAPARPPALTPGMAWVLVAPPGASAALGRGRFAHVFEGA